MEDKTRVQDALANVQRRVVGAGRSGVLDPSSEALAQYLKKREPFSRATARSSARTFPFLRPVAYRLSDLSKLSKRIVQV